MILRCDDCYMFVVQINDDVFDIYTEKKIWKSIRSDQTSRD